MYRSFWLKLYIRTMVLDISVMAATPLPDSQWAIKWLNIPGWGKCFTLISLQRIDTISWWQLRHHLWFSYLQEHHWIFRQMDKNLGLVKAVFRQYENRDWNQISDFSPQKWAKSLVHYKNRIFTALFSRTGFFRKAGCPSRQLTISIEAGRG